MTQTLITRTEHVCSECGSVIAPHSGFVVCENCGLTHEREYVDGTFELGAISDHQGSASHYGSVSSVPGIATCLGSDVGYHRTLELRGITTASRARIVKIRRIQTRHRYGNEGLVRTLESLRSVCSSLELPKIVLDRAAYLIKKAKANGFKGHYPILSARCLLIATKENRSPVTDNEVIHEWQQRHSSVNIHKLIGVAFWIQENLGIRTRPKKPLDYLPRIISSLKKDTLIRNRLEDRSICLQNFFYYIETTARKILLSNPVHDNNSRSRLALAASLCYYLARKQWGVLMTQKMVADASGVVEYTIRNTITFWKQFLE